MGWRSDRLRFALLCRRRKNVDLQIPSHRCRTAGRVSNSDARFVAKGECRNRTQGGTDSSWRRRTVAAIRPRNGARSGGARKLPCASPSTTTSSSLMQRRIVNVKTMMSALRRGLSKLMANDVRTLTRADYVMAIAAIERDGRMGAAEDLRKHSRTSPSGALAAALPTTIRSPACAGRAGPAPSGWSVIERGGPCRMLKFGTFGRPRKTSARSVAWCNWRC